MKKLFLGIIFLMSLIILSCAGGAGGGSSSDSGRVVIAGSRAAAQKTDLQTFVLKGALGSGELKTLKTWNDCTEMEGCVIELDTGNWTFSLEARYSSGKTYTYSGKQTATIKSGEDTVVSFILRNQGFAPGQAGVTDLILSNGYACELGDSIAGASVVGQVIGFIGSGDVLAMMKLSGDDYLIGGTSSTYGQLKAIVESKGARFPTMGEHSIVLSRFSELGIVRPTTGYLASSTMSGGDGRSFYLGDPDSSAGSSGSYMGTPDDYVCTLYAVGVKTFPVN